MYGFTIIKSENTVEFTTSYMKTLGFKTKSHQYFLVGYNYFKKFENDKLFEEDKDYIIGIDGVILNLKLLKNQYAISDYFQLIVHLFQKENINFVNNIKGEFNGFFFDKNTEALFIFNNKTATKQVFYTKFDKYIVISQSIKSIIDIKQSLNVESMLNSKAVYDMLTFGAMVENYTLVEEVFKLGAGEYLNICEGEILLNKYYDYNSIDYTISNKNIAIKKFDEAFIEALKLEYEKDNEYVYEHIATLSGGLDSRMNVMLSNEIGFKSKTFCFSQSNYEDEKIARKITDDLNLDFEFIPLDGGGFMRDLEEINSISSGLQNYLGGAHYNYALKKMNLSRYGMIHTGQIGDGVLGSFVSKGGDENFLSKTITTKFLDKISIDNNHISKYKNEEVFKLYQRVFNLANVGSYITEHYKTYLVSPFFDNDVIDVGLSIDPSLKYNQNIYIDWINKMHPEVAKYKWERTGFLPNKKWKTEFSRYTKKLRKEYFILVNREDKLSMTPENFWLNTNTKNLNFYTNYYSDNIELLASNTDLLNDFNEVFKSGTSAGKCIVLTVLEVIKKFNLKV